MNYIKKLTFLSILALIFLFGCTREYGSIKIKNENNLTLEVGDTIYLKCVIVGNVNEVTWKSSDECVAVDNNGKVTAIAAGKSTITVTDGKYLDSITITVCEVKYQESIKVTLSANKITVPETLTISCSYYVNNTLIEENVKCDFEFIEGSELCSITDNILTSKEKGVVIFKARYKDITSEEVKIEIFDKEKIKEVTLKSSSTSLFINKVTKLSVDVFPAIEYTNLTYQIIEGDSVIIIDNLAKAVKTGTTKIQAIVDGVYSNIITITVSENLVTPELIIISCSKENLLKGESAILDFTVYPDNSYKDIVYYVEEGNAIINNNVITALDSNPIAVVGVIKNIKSNTIIINENVITEDPYKNVSSDEFYKSYKKATSYLDAYYRSEHGFMSGDISLQDQEPAIANRPSENNVFVKNSSLIYSSDKNIYYVLNSSGKIVNQIFKGGAYVTLEEVSAYIFAYNDVPANYIEKKSGKPTNSIWGEYLRVNHSYFSGDTDKYPYEPILPNINGCGGNLYYYELDLGTTGTDCDPNYEVTIYNDGKKITRGAARIVYSRYDENYDEINDINEKHLFYTYNHYNDFQEYLNYEGGWGHMFGNITGGGKLSSKTDYNPTNYIPVILKEFYN